MCEKGEDFFTVGLNTAEATILIPSRKYTGTRKAPKPFPGFHMQSSQRKVEGFEAIHGFALEVNRIFCKACHLLGSTAS
jgi:hypothetical protein